MTERSVDSLTRSIECVHQLKFSLTHLLRLLSHSDPSTSSVSRLPLHSTAATDKHLVHATRDSLDTITHQLQELYARVCAIYTFQHQQSMATQTSTASPSTSIQSAAYNMTHLAIADPRIHVQASITYHWLDRLHELAALLSSASGISLSSSTVLSRRSLAGSTQTLAGATRQGAAPCRPPAPGVRAVGGSYQQHWGSNQSPASHHHVDTVLSALVRAYSADMRIKVSRASHPQCQVAPRHHYSHACGQSSPYTPHHTLAQPPPDGAASLTRVCHIQLDGVLQACVTMHALQIEWATVRGCDEELFARTEHEQTGSRHAVFRRVCDHVLAAVVHFSCVSGGGGVGGTTGHPELALRGFMTWLRSYVTLFSAVCVGCNMRLVNALPPTWRDFKTLQPYHDECRPY